MKTARAFALIEALAVIVIVIIVLLVVVVGFVASEGGHKHAAPKMVNSTQLRGVMTAFSMWSDANGPPGLAATAPVLAGGALPGSLATPSSNCPANARDPSVVARFWALVAAPGVDPLNAKMFVNPVSRDVSETVWSNPNCTISPGVTTAGAAGFSSNNVSYALLSTRMGSEWRDNTNAGCPMICDRNRGTSAAPSSSWSATGWMGCVAWGDVHTTLENSPILSVTIYGSASPTSNLWGPATSSNAGMLNPGS